jgi:hypothetical protein
MAEFSADAERRALAPWTIQIGGRVYTARPVSRPAVVAFWAAISNPASTPEEQELALATLLRVAFPREGLRTWWRGDPVLQILALDYRVREKALESFFASLAPLHRPSAPGTNGTNGSRPSLAAESA